MKGRLYSAFFLIAMFLPLSAAAQSAESYPSRPVTLVVTVAAGSVADLLARVIAPKLSERLKQPVVVENKVGASGVIGNDFVAKAAPNGYTLMLLVNSFTMVPSLYRNLPYDPIADFAAISKVATSGYSFVVNPRVFPAKDMNEALALIKSNPDKYTYGSPGKGTAHHLAMELFKQQLGLDILHVPHKDLSGALTSLIGGHVDMMFAPTGSVLPPARTGSLRILAVTGANRSPIAPDVPTYRELGMTFLDDVDGYWGLMAPAKTPQDVLARLNREIVAVLATPDIREKLASQDVITTSSTPGELAEQIKFDLRRWAKLISDAKITSQ